MLGLSWRSLPLTFLPALLTGLALSCGDSGSGSSDSSTASATSQGTSDASAGSDATDTSDASGGSTEVDSSDPEAVCGAYESDTEAPPIQSCGDPNDETVAGPGDEEGQPCCTNDESCSGAEIAMGSLPMPSQLGVWLVCVDGVWTLNQADCIDSCHDKSKPAMPICYSGCFWQEGNSKPVCGCRAG